MRKSSNKKRKNRIKDRFNSYMQKKLVVLSGLVLLAFIGLAGRLIYINRTDGEAYKKIVLDQKRYDSTTLPFKRGDILDAKGNKLAYSEKVYNLVVDSKLINQDKDALNPTMQAVAKCFDVNETELREFITQNPDNQYNVVLKQLSYDEIAPFLDIQADTKANPHVKGIWFEEEYKRIYPGGRLACDIVGFTGSDNNGNCGLEEFYNDTLNGINGREYGYLNDDSNLERTTKAARDGASLVTSIDSNIQQIVEKYIKEFNDQHKGEYREGQEGSKNTGVVVMNPKNGEVLAMASYPDFDLNDPKNLSDYYSEEAIAEMDDDTMYETLNELWRNFCISDTYEPGSTAKSLTISAGLDCGALTGNESFFCGGKKDVSGHTIKCHNHYGHGTVSLSGALEQSCNMALIDINSMIGKEKFTKYLHNFNIGLKTNIDLAGETRTNTLVYDPEKMVASDLAISSFGQGYNVTMIQIASAFCSIINGGYYYQPHVVTALKDASGATIEKVEPKILRETISESVSQQMRTYLANVCTLGTGKTAVPAGYLIGGKTGTAEKQPRRNGNYVVSFIGFAPVNDPKVVVYAVIDEPNVADQPHSTFAQEIVRGIFTEVLPYMNVFRTEEISEEEQQELEALGIIRTVSENGIGEETMADGDTGDAGEVAEPEALPEGSPDGGDVEKSYTIDPKTGYAVDPETGKKYDPNTFEPIEETGSFME